MSAETKKIVAYRILSLAIGIIWNVIENQRYYIIRWDNAQCLSFLMKFRIQKMDSILYVLRFMKQIVFPLLTGGRLLSS